MAENRSVLTQNELCLPMKIFSAALDLAQFNSISRVYGANSTIVTLATTLYLI